MPFLITYFYHYKFAANQTPEIIPEAVSDVHAQVPTITETLAPDTKAPEFLEMIKHVIVLEGEEARFDAHVDALPEPSIDWYRNGELIPDEGRFVHIDAVKEEVFTLVIENVNLDDSGEYTCIAINDVDEVSCTALLTVNPKEIAPDFTKEPETSTFDVDSGKDVKLDLKVSGKPEPEVEWFKDEKPLKTNKRVNVLVKDDERTLHIRGGKPEDSGVYKCVAKNRAGTVARTYEVNIKGMPVSLKL